MKALLLSDIHLSDRPPSSCTESYNDDLLDLLGETVAVAEQHQVDVVIWAGDIFHSKAPSRNSHRLVQKVIGIGKAYQRPWYIVPGNHDIQHDQLSSIWDTQPLGVLFRAGAKALIGWAAPGVHFKSPDYLPLFGVPWQQEWDDEHVFTALRDYTQERSSPVLVVAHAPLYPPGLELTYENYPAERWALAMDGGKGSCYYGHVHEYHGVWECGGVTFCNDGALSRGSLHEHNLTRQVMCTIWDSATCEFTEVPLLKARPASEVFRLREKQEVADASLKLDEFLAGVGGTQFEVLSVETVLAHVRGLGVGKDVEDEVAELLEWSSHQEGR